VTSPLKKYDISGEIARNTFLERRYQNVSVQKNIEAIWRLLGISDTSVVSQLMSCTENLGLDADRLINTLFSKIARHGNFPASGSQVSQKIYIYMLSSLDLSGEDWLAILQDLPLSRDKLTQLNMAIPVSVPQEQPLPMPRQNLSSSKYHESGQKKKT